MFEHRDNPSEGSKIKNSEVISNVGLNKSNPESFSMKDHNPLFTKFWQELLVGKGTEKGEKEVEELVEAYTNVEPINPLSKQEAEKIKEHLRFFFRLKIDSYNKEYNQLINDQILLLDAKNLNLTLGINYVGSKFNILNSTELSKQEKYKKPLESLMEKGVKFLTTAEKVKLFNEPEFFGKARYFAWNSKLLYVRNGLFGSGSRRLTQEEGGYYHSNEEFLEEVRGVRERTGKSKIRILDVGSNFGFALKDMKDLDSNIETFNMTIDEHPALHGDHIVRYPAEMMPAEFKEIMDIVDSQVAFRYFLYSDIALNNVIKSLSVGGVARISYEVGHTSNSFVPGVPRITISEQELNNRQKVLWTGIKELVEKGYLDISGSSSIIKEAIQNPSEKHIHGFVHLIKNKSIPD